MRYITLIKFRFRETRLFSARPGSAQQCCLFLKALHPFKPKQITQKKRSLIWVRLLLLPFKTLQVFKALKKVSYFVANVP